MRINEENILKEMRKSQEKSKRINSYKVSFMQFNGKNEDLTFNQGYDASTDVFNPFFVRVYKDKNYIMSGTGDNIEKSYNSLITQLIQYKEKAEIERNTAIDKLSQVYKIINPINDNEDLNDYF